MLYNLKYSLSDFIYNYLFLLDIFYYLNGNQLLNNADFSKSLAANYQNAVILIGKFDPIL